MFFAIAALTMTKIPPMGWVLIGIFVLLFVVSPLAKLGRKNERAQSLQSMGFVDITAEQAFESPKLIGLYLDMPGRVASPVGKGSSAIGDTLIFDLVEIDINNADFAHTVVGFRVSASLPDFHIRHLRWLENRGKTGNSGTQHARAQITIGKGGMVPDVYAPQMDNVEIGGNDEFAKKFVVKSTDPAQMQRIVTASLVEKLVALHDSNLEIVKAKDWLFVYRSGGVAVGGGPTMMQTRPGKYPELLQNAVDLANRLDLKSATTTA